MANSWMKLYDVPIFKGMKRLIGFRKIGELLIAAQRFLISYDPKAAQVKNLGIRSNTKVWCEYSFHTDTYTESLALLGSPLQIEEAEVGWEEDGDEGSEEKEESDDRQYILSHLF